MIISFIVAYIICYIGTGDIPVIPEMIMFISWFLYVYLGSLLFDLVPADSGGGGSIGEVFSYDNDDDENYFFKNMGGNL